MLDNQDLAVCNHCECPRRLECRRYNSSILSAYDMEQMGKFFDCFVKKYDVKKEV
jgi:hypothetical protein